MSGWQQAKLGELIVEAAYGTSVKCSDSAEGIPVLRMGNVRYDGTLDLSDLKYASLTDTERAKFGIEEGDILFNRTNSKELVGKTGLWDGRFPAAAASYFIRVRVARDIVCPKWVWRFMNSAAMKDRLFATARGAIGQANINSEELKSFVLPVPPLNEQRRIVGLLDRAAEIRRRADAARVKARAVIPALFLDMFGDPATNPKGWRQVRFSEVVSEFRYGTNKKCHDSQSDGDVAVLRIPNVIGGRIDWSDLKFSTLPAKERAKTDLRTGDVLFVRTNGNPEYIGRCAMFEGTRSASYASYLIRARLTADLLPFFAVIHFNHKRYRSFVVRAGRTTAGNFNLSTEGLGALRIVIPPIPLQTAFAEQTQRLEATARALDIAATRAEAIAAALSAEMFGVLPGRQPGNGA